MRDVICNMKKIRITITQELEVPDGCVVVTGAGSSLIKNGGVYLKPEIEWLQSKEYSDKKMKFQEADEKMNDFILEALAFEKEDIGEL